MNPAVVSYMGPAPAEVFGPPYTLQIGRATTLWHVRRDYGARMLMALANFHVEDASDLRPPPALQFQSPLERRDTFWSKKAHAMAKSVKDRLDVIVSLQPDEEGHPERMQELCRPSEEPWITLIELMSVPCKYEVRETLLMLDRLSRNKVSSAHLVDRRLEAELAWQAEEQRETTIRFARCAAVSQRTAHRQHQRYVDLQSNLERSALPSGEPVSPTPAQKADKDVESTSS